MKLPITYIRVYSVGYTTVNKIQINTKELTGSITNK